MVGEGKWTALLAKNAVNVGNRLTDTTVPCPLHSQWQSSYSEERSRRNTHSSEEFHSLASLKIQCMKRCAPKIEK